MAVNDKEYALLSNAVYHDGDYLEPKGFTSIMTGPNDDAGFFAEAFRNENNEVVIAFRGSANKLNYWHDFKMWSSGEKPPEFDKAMEFYNRVEKFCKDNKLSLVGMTGHSLGGSMVQYVDARCAAEKGYQIPGVAFAPAGIGDVCPGLDLGSINARNYIRNDDQVPGKMDKQAGNETVPLPSTSRSYELKTNDAGVTEIVYHIRGDSLTEHSMLGYLVDVGNLDTRSLTVDELKEKYAVLPRGGGSTLDSLGVVRGILETDEKKYGNDDPRTVETRANYKQQLAEAFPHVPEKDRDKMVVDHVKENLRLHTVIEGKHPSNLDNNEARSPELSQHPTKIGDLRKTLNGQMDEINKQLKELNQERRQVEGAPLTKEQAEKLAASNHLNGADKELDKQAQELQAKQDKLSQYKEDTMKYGKENGLDTTLWRHAPEIFKGEGLKYYESSMATVENNTKVYDQQATEIQAKRDQHQEQLQTPEAKSEIAKNSEEILVQDKERIGKLEGLDQKINELTNEKHDIMTLRDIIPSRKLDREIDVQGDPKNVQNLLSQTDQLKQQATEMQQAQAQAQSCGQGLSL